MIVCNWCGKGIHKRDLFQVQLKHQATCSSNPEDIHLHGTCFDRLMDFLKEREEK